MQPDVGKREDATGRDELSLDNGDKVILWEEDCGNFEIEATLLLDYKHPMMFERALWAKAVVQNS